MTGFEDDIVIKVDRGAINLKVVQDMWEKDSELDMDNLHQESINTPRLHAKYYDLYNMTKLLKERAEHTRKNIRHERYEFYSGKADPEIYQENPFPKKIRDKETMQKYLDADQELTRFSLKIKYYDIILDYIDNILNKMIANRSYQIRAAIDFMKFNSGLG